ncbi:MAG TPA: 23S rRNA (adenine(2503)-C(2))-methyltransferase RlmN [Polyangiaceae bacterium]|nr:23S rRNA (adenine(2503)-C(2))-methyltransferase RlmN [Polyangiaceae bacterium]
MSTHAVARTPEEWKASLAARGERPFRAQQVFRWIHRHGVLEPDKMTDLAPPVRAWLADEGVGTVAETVKVHRSTDSTRKMLLRMGDGATIETVMIPGTRGNDADVAAGDDDDDSDASADVVAGADALPGVIPGPNMGASTGRAVRGDRVTQCISTQVGCAMGCIFCASGVAGLKRHLGAHEIVAQVILGRTVLDPSEELRNIVLMGMGEPLHNYDATVRALRLLTHPMGMNLSPRRITVSTSGLIPEIARLGEDFAGQISLAISLHAADDETRTRLMPINKKYPLPELMAALRAYPLPKRRRIFIEYTLVAGKNDELTEARKLARLLRDVPVKINLIPMNSIEASSLGAPAMERVHAFQQSLIDDGYTCFVRKRRGDDVAAACGQLALLGAKPKVRVDRT